jgi:beta-carotene 3-hydroxylase
MNFSTIVFCMVIIVSTFILWELIAWFTHKYVMHGYLWDWHKSHHTAHDHATLVKYNPYLLAVNVGLFCYETFYFIFHDLIGHHSINFRIRRKANVFNVLFTRIIFIIANIPRMDVRPLDFKLPPRNMGANSFALHLTKSEIH